jgi:formylmethanofuran dehydrogenase subunit E
MLGKENLDNASSFGIAGLLSSRQFYFLEVLMRDFQSLLQTAAERHGHLCAGQVLGVRLSLCALNELGIDPEREPKRLIVFVEIDRCATDAITSVTGCSLGRRSLKYVDYGKMAATFVDTLTGRAVRVVALDSSRERVAAYAPPGLAPAAAQLAGYQVMPDSELFEIQEVRVPISKFDLPGHPLTRVACARCGEGVNDGREIVRAGETLCRACASHAYYERTTAPASLPISPLVPVRL